MRWDGQINLRRLVFKWLWGGKGKSLIDVSYSSDYEVGWANYSYKSRIQVTIGGMGKPLLEVSYLSDYEVGWANHT